MLYNPHTVALDVDHLYKRCYLQTRALQNSVGLGDDQSMFDGLIRRHSIYSKTPHYGQGVSEGTLKALCRSRKQRINSVPEEESAPWRRRKWEEWRKQVK